MFCCSFPFLRVLFFIFNVTFFFLSLLVLFFVLSKFLPFFCFDVIFSFFVIVFITFSFILWFNPTLLTLVASACRGSGRSLYLFAQCRLCRHIGPKVKFGRSSKRRRLPAKLSFTRLVGGLHAHRVCHLADSAPHFLSLSSFLFPLLFSQINLLASSNYSPHSFFFSPVLFFLPLFVSLLHFLRAFLFRWALIYFQLLSMFVSYAILLWRLYGRIQEMGGQY